MFSHTTTNGPEQTGNTATRRRPRPREQSHRDTQCQNTKPPPSHIHAHHGRPGPANQTAPTRHQRKTTTTTTHHPLTALAAPQQQRSAHTTRTPNYTLLPASRTAPPDTKPPNTATRHQSPPTNSTTHRITNCHRRTPTPHTEDPRLTLHLTITQPYSVTHHQKHHNTAPKPTYGHHDPSAHQLPTGHTDHPHKHHNGPRDAPHPGKTNGRGRANRGTKHSPSLNTP